MIRYVFLETHYEGKFMNRRHFIKIIGTGMLINPISSLFAMPSRILDYDKWNSFRLTYHVTLPSSGKHARLWLPLPNTNETAFQFTQGSLWDGTAKNAQFTTLKNSSSPVFFAEWQGNSERQITVSSIVKTSNHFIDFTKYNINDKIAIPNHIKAFLKPTRLMPLNGIVRDTASTILQQSNAATTIDKARAIYNWVIDNTQHNPNLRGRGTGDIKFMLENQQMHGKDVDINSLFVGLSRAIGIPSRIQFGIRMNESELHPSLGKINDITQLQHSRAEFYLNNIGWIPVNPADVNKVIKLANLPRDHPNITNLRKKFFGTWEMNWVTFNHLQDIQLTPHSIAGKLPFFMFPHAEIDGQILDSLDPDNFTYKITSSLLIGTGATF
jgi:transglutaminase-like putative cysteine protease